MYLFNEFYSYDHVNNKVLVRWFVVIIIHYMNVCAEK
ncbi:hypothetical protein EL75_0472 [Escherichia coli]|nr:hypothetical protein EL77_0512 [Escherichia coli]KGM71863.1 hypothetical protein EL75_0472 [Escherichia coli]KGM75752.1 hypothetical protein EL78_0522 [Escherichia coli]KGM84057.1 hypothetical protein EL80_0485 [Escherichia coli]KGM85414.1 hypothetical protein EL79_0494 [Escherichia coli]